MDFKVLISGSRDGCHMNIIKFMINYILEYYPNRNYILIHGHAKGVDTLVKDYCEALNWKCISFEPDWKNLGKKAGPMRNQDMINTNPDFGLFIPSLTSKGTIDCYQRFIKLNKPGLHYDPQHQLIIEI